MKIKEFETFNESELFQLVLKTVRENNIYSTIAYPKLIQMLNKNDMIHKTTISILESNNIYKYNDQGIRFYEVKNEKEFQEEFYKEITLLILKI